MWCGLVFVLFCGVFADRAIKTPVVSNYFPNWAQYRSSPYKFTPDQISSGAVQALSIINYAFAFFCPDPSWPDQPYWVTQMHLCQGKQAYEVIKIDPKDPTFYSELVGKKSDNPDLKVVLSIGGWTFPSHFFSKMVSTSASRQTFIQSCLSFINQYHFDGIDIDWEYPCSAARQDEVKITCYHMDKVVDQGGTCPDDKTNLLLLVQEMRKAFGDKYIISVASQANMVHANNGFAIKEMSAVIDLWNVMTYDYTVSDIPSSKWTAPNSPLYPVNAANVNNMSVATTIEGYLKAGATPGKVLVGIPYYGHTWYIPGQSNWQHFGVVGTIQGQCCGQFAQTYGAKYGQYSNQCGLLMYSEILNNIGGTFTTVFDNGTQSAIGYSSSNNVWLGWCNKQAMTATLDWTKAKNIGGAFGFDLSMDSLTGGSFTFEATIMMRTILG
jgi:chitinase